VITKLFEFYCTLQVILLIHLKIQTSQPVTLVSFLQAIWAIVYIKIDIKIFKQYVKIPSFVLELEQNSIMLLLGGLAAAGVFLLLLVVVVFLVLRYVKIAKLKQYA